RGTIADPYQARRIEAGQVLEVLLGQVRVAIDPVDDLHGEVVVVGAVPNPVDEVGRLLRKPGAEQGGNAIGSIAQPAIAGVQVALAARLVADRRSRGRP